MEDRGRRQPSGWGLAQRLWEETGAKVRTNCTGVGVKVRGQAQHQAAGGGSDASQQAMREDRGAD